MSVVCDQRPDEAEHQILDTTVLRAELDEIQERLDRLARCGVSPFEVAQLQRDLDAARDELLALTRA